MISVRMLGLDNGAGAVEFDHETQRQLGDVPAQLTAHALHALGAEAAAVGLAEAEADPGHPLGAVAAVGVQFAHHPIQVDALVGECAQRGVTGGQHEVAEAWRGLAGAAAGPRCCRSSR